jgi:UDP-N-acetylglucosamine 2-epimerase
MIKVMTIVGTRPELIRLSRIISKLDENTDHKLVHTGQNFDFELNQIFFDDLGIRKPNLFLDAACKTASESIGKIISESDKAIRKLKPDAILVLGDTNSSLSAIAAKRLKVPIFHMEAGNRCFDFRVPEEINRRIVDHISDINLPYSKIARDYLLKEGLPADQIIKIGSPMKEVLNFYSDAIESSNIIEDLKLNKGDLLCSSAHREENVDSNENFRKILIFLIT